VIGKIENSSNVIRSLPHEAGQVVTTDLLNKASELRDKRDRPNQNALVAVPSQILYLSYIATTPNLIS